MLDELTLQKILEDSNSTADERAMARRQLNALRPQAPPPEQKTPMEQLEAEWTAFSAGRTWKYSEFCESKNIRGPAFEVFKHCFKPFKSALPHALRAVLNGGDPQSFFEDLRKQYEELRSGDTNQNYPCGVILIENALRRIIDTALNDCAEAQVYLNELREHVDGFERLVINKFYPQSQEVQ